MNANDVLVIVALVCGVVIGAVVVLRMLDWLTSGRRQSPEEQRAWVANLNSRLLKPQFHELESHFKKPIPEELRSLYTNNALVLGRDLCVKQPGREDEEYYIQHFLPADKQSIDETWYEAWECRFPFAMDDFGNYYFVSMSDADIGECPDKCPVFYIDHDIGDTRRLADSLREFLSWASDGVNRT